MRKGELSLMNGDRLSVRQITILVFIFSIGSSTLNTSGVVVALAGHDGPLCIIYGVLVGIGMTYVYSLLVKKYPHKTFMEMLDEALGKGLSSVLSFTFALIMLYAGPGSMLYDMSAFTNTQILPDTPAYTIVYLYIVLGIYGLRMGIRAIAITAELVFPIFLTLFGILILGVAPKFDFPKMLPLLQSEPLGVYQGTLVYASYSVFVLVCFITIFPTSSQPDQHVFRSLSLGMVGGGMLVFLITYSCILVMGVELTSQELSPAYNLGREIRIGKFLTRIEVITAMGFYMGFFVKMLVYFYVGLKALQHALRLQQYKSLVAPVLLLIGLLSAEAFENPLISFIWHARIWTLCSIYAGVILPLLIMIGGKLRKPNP